MRSALESPLSLEADGAGCNWTLLWGRRQRLNVTPAGWGRDKWRCLLSFHLADIFYPYHFLSSLFRSWLSIWMLVTSLWHYLSSCRLAVFLVRSSLSLFYLDCVVSHRHFSLLWRLWCVHTTRFSSHIKVRRHPSKPWTHPSNSLRDSPYREEKATLNHYKN